jgi:polar amino acid transport system substrate-binding protein
MKMMAVRYFIYFIVFVATLSGSNLEKVSLQLDWKYQFEFAGFIAAKEKGYYRDVGLDVELREYQDGIDIVSDVLSKRATYGVYNSSIVVEKGRIKPIILLSTYFQQSPLIFVAKKGIENPADLIGKTIMGTKDELKYSSLALLLSHFGISSKNARFVDHNFAINDFINGKIDVMSAFRSNQLYELDRLGIEYNIIDPAEYGFMMSAVNLFTSQNEAIEYTMRTQKFIDATNRGWKYALDHPDEVIDILRKSYHVQKSREALVYEAKVTKKLMMRDFYPIGESNAELSVRVFKQLVRSGSLDADQRLGHFLFADVIQNARNTFTLTTSEKEYLLTKKKITMCVDPEWYPLEAIREGKHIGIASDIMKNFQNKLGIPIELVPVTSWNESIEHAKARKCDILSLATSNPERLKYLDFTTPALTMPIVMATTKDKPFTENIGSLKGEKLALVKGYAITENLKVQFPELDIVEVVSINEGLNLVENGEVYGYIDNLMVVSSYTQKEYNGIFKISSRLETKDEMGIGTRNDEPILHDIFEKLVQSLDEQTMQEIYNRWTATIEQIAWLDEERMRQIITAFILLIGAFTWRYFDLQRYNKRLLKLSTTDKLTGLYNRQKIDEKLSEEEKKVSRYTDYHCSLMMIDVDLFKKINDTMGHQEGDKILQSLAKAMQKSLRQTDTIGRWGGEEFMVILSHTTLDEALNVAESLRLKVAQYPFLTLYPITVSIGVGEFSQAEEVHELVGRVDAALYRAKEIGRNNVALAL